MTGIKKSTDAGLSNADERPREERLAREAAAVPMLYPAPELPDATLIQNVRFSTRIRKALNAEGMKTIGEIREASDAELLSLPDFGKESVAYLRILHEGPDPRYSNC